MHLQVREDAVSVDHKSEEVHDIICEHVASQMHLRHVKPVLLLHLQRTQRNNISPLCVIITDPKSL